MTASAPEPRSRHGLELKDPGAGGGFRDVLRHRYLLKLLVRKEVHVRYQGTLLGMAWGYVRPAMRFFVYFVVIGIVLQINRSIPNFGLHIVAGMICVQIFNEGFTTGTQSVLRNKALVRKIYLPRELFPTASIFVTVVNAAPFLVVLALAGLATGWHPTWHVLPSTVLGLVLVTTFAAAMGLLFSAFNVYFRDFSKVVEVVTMLTMWSVPMIYAYEMVRDAMADRPWWVLELYHSNPIAISGMLLQRAFWLPTVDEEYAGDPVLDLAPDLYVRGLVLLGISLLLIVVAQRIFSRLEGNFAEQL
jgi:ABC-2 type transport system permease protein